MVRLRCTLFGRLMRERRDRELNGFEHDFVARHTLTCADCRARMHISDMGLDALSRARLEPEENDLAFIRLPPREREPGVLARLLGL